MEHRACVMEQRACYGKHFFLGNRGCFFEADQAPKKQQGTEDCLICPIWLAQFG